MEILILATFEVYCTLCLQKSGLYTYKVYGVLEDVSPEVCAQVYLDIEYRKIWDKYVKGINVHLFLFS